MADANLDYQLLILCLFVLGLLVLLPVAEPPREGTPTDDTTHTRRH